jgi:hypothetical protein
VIALKIFFDLRAHIEARGGKRDFFSERKYRHRIAISERTLA